MFQKFSQDFCKSIFQFLGKVPINARFFTIFVNLFLIHIFEHLSAFQQLLYNFPNFFQNFIKFLRNFSTVSSLAFQTFSRINLDLCNFFKVSIEKSEIFMKYQIHTQV